MEEAGHCFAGDVQDGNKDGCCVLGQWNSRIRVDTTDDHRIRSRKFCLAKSPIRPDTCWAGQDIQVELSWLASLLLSFVGSELLRRCQCLHFHHQRFCPEIGLALFDLRQICLLESQMAYVEYRRVELRGLCSGLKWR